MLQVARQLTDTVDGILPGKRYLILDRGTKYCQVFRDFVKREGIEAIRLPPRSPNLNAYAERWVRGVRDECLSTLIPIGQGTLRRALRGALMCASAQIRGRATPRLQSAERPPSLLWRRGRSGRHGPARASAATPPSSAGRRHQEPFECRRER